MNKRDILKYVYAFCLGDGGVFYSGKNARFQANNLEKHNDYVYWRAGILEHLTSVNVFLSKDTRPGRKPVLQTVTKTHPTYTTVRERIYLENRKIIDPHQLTFIDWETVAILYQDDGSIYNDPRCNATPQITIATKGFSYGDNVLLKRALEEKLGIVFNINRQKAKTTGNYYWFLRLRTKDSDTFLNNVEPFVKPSFQYKLIRTNSPCVEGQITQGDDIV